MKQPKTVHILIAGLLLLCTLWAATPKAYVHSLLNHRHSNIVTPNGETSVQNEDQDCDFDKYNTPVYFTIFKFINHFIPVKSKEEAFFMNPNNGYDSFKGSIDSSRAPPVA